jgi:hypothetical protein
MGLETVEILMEVEDHFRIKVPDAVASRCITVADLQNVIVDMLVARGRERSSELKDEVFHDLVDIVVKYNGMAAADIRPESRWVGDITPYG